MFERGGFNELARFTRTSTCFVPISFDLLKVTSSKILLGSQLSPLSYSTFPSIIIRYLLYVFLELPIYRKNFSVFFSMLMQQHYIV